MSTMAATTKEFMQEYMLAFSGRPKDGALIDEYVADPDLKQHIFDTEAAFPGYELQVHQIVVEGSMAAVNMTFSGVHKGPFAGIEATGKTITAGGMVFYHVEGGMIQKFWIQLDFAAIMAQLRA
jgi:predicted ester cyclase